MTVESLKTKEVYLGNGKNTQFPVPFPYTTVDDIHLLLTDNDGDRDVTSNFTITVSQYGDTTVIFPERGTPLPYGQKLTIYRKTQKKQIVSLSDVGAFSPEELEISGFDRTVMMVQELQEEVDRSIKVPLTSDQTSDELLEEIFSNQNNAVQSAKEAKEALASATNQAGIAIKAADKSIHSAQDAINAAEKAVNAAKNIDGFANATHAFHGITLDEKMNLLWVKGEEGDVLNAKDFLYSAILPTEARFFFENGQIFVELPFTQ